MTKTPKKRGRPKKVVQLKPTNLKDPKLPDEIITWEDEGGAVVPEPEEPPSPMQILRKQQWDSFNKRDREYIGLTEEEFLTKEDITGMGPNSYFTPRDQR